MLSVNFWMKSGGGKDEGLSTVPAVIRHVGPELAAWPGHVGFSEESLSQFIINSQGRGQKNDRALGGVMYTVVSGSFSGNNITVFRIRWDILY